MIPASNRKLFIGLTAAECFGPLSTIPTELWIDGPVVDGSLLGDLVLEGLGDPSLGGRYYTDRDPAFAPFLQALRARGITEIKGRVMAGVSRFDRVIIAPKWQVEDVGEWWGAPVSSLAFNENILGVTVDVSNCPPDSITTDPHFVPVATSIDCTSEGSLKAMIDERNRLMVTGERPEQEPGRLVTLLPSIAEPGLYAAQALDDFLRRSGIAIDGEPAIAVEPAERIERIWVIESPPMAALLSTMLKVSQNLYAEMLLKRLAIGDAPASYEKARGIEAKHLMETLALRREDFSFQDGSGLSTDNLVTPQAIITTLRYMADPAREGFWKFVLATAGDEGTLRRRLAGLEGRLFAKTGTLSIAVALSGWVELEDGRKRFFSIVVNHYTASRSEVRAAIDEIVRLIAAGGH